MKHITHYILKLKTCICILAIVSLTSCGTNSNEKGETEDKSTTEETKDNGEGIGHFHNVTVGALDGAMATKGEAIFKTKCAACHKTTDEKVVGPGLKGVTERRKPTWILNMITNPQEMTQKDPTAKKLLEEHLTQMTFQDVNDDDARSIVEFLRKNDGAK